MQTSSDFSNTREFYGVPSSRLSSDEATRRQSGDNVVTEGVFRSTPGHNPANLAHQAQNFQGANYMSNFNAYQQSPTFPSAQQHAYHPSMMPQPSYLAAPVSHHHRQDHHHDLHHGGGFGTHAHFDNRPLGSHPPYHPYGGQGPAYFQHMPLQYSYMPHQQMPTYHPGYGPGALLPAPETRRGPRLYPNAVPIMPSPALPVMPVVPTVPYDPAHHVTPLLTNSFLLFRFLLY